MNGRIYRIWATQSEKSTEIIRKNYSSSFMSNAKWLKLMEGLVMSFDEIFIQYKLIYDEVLEGSLFINVDTPPYFIEPISYREVEWVEFPKEYEDWVNTDNLKAGMKTCFQDLRAIKKVIEKIGQLRTDEYDDRIRLYGYL